MGQVFVGHDWAEIHHDIYIEDADGARLGKARVPDGIEGVARFHEIVADIGAEPGEVVVATETDRGLFVGAMVAAGYQVLAVNPLSVARYRQRHSTSGAKSDPGDAYLLAEIARLDRHNHRPVAGDSELVEAVKVLARSHQSLIWTRQRQTNQLRSTLREFYPAALAAFDSLASNDALAVLGIAPTPTLGRGLSRSKIAAALRRGGRSRRVDERAVEIQQAFGEETAGGVDGDVATELDAAVLHPVEAFAFAGEPEPFVNCLRPRCTPRSPMCHHPADGAAGDDVALLAQLLVDAPWPIAGVIRCPRPPELGGVSGR